MCSSDLTIMNEPVDFWPKWSWRIDSARAVSVPGREKRFVSSAERPDIAASDTTSTTSQTAKTAQRSRSIRRVQSAMGSDET